jgi:hypothetical protein
MAGTSGRLYSEPSNFAIPLPGTPNLSRVLNATRQREKGLRNGKAEAPPVLRFVVALFRIFGKATSFRRSENRPSGPLEVALFRIKGKENYRGLRLERFSTERRFDEAPQVR